jgi:hypothetical protein
VRHELIVQREREVRLDLEALRLDDVLLLHRVDFGANGLLRLDAEVDLLRGRTLRSVRRDLADVHVAAAGVATCCGRARVTTSGRSCASRGGGRRLICIHICRRRRWRSRIGRCGRRGRRRPALGLLLLGVCRLRHEHQGCRQ